MESPSGRIRQGASAGQNCDSEPDDELLLELLEELLLEELLLFEELLLVEELLLEELLDDELPGVGVLLPPQAPRATALISAKQIPRKYRT